MKINHGVRVPAARGSFAAHGRESGKVKTDFTRSATCNGTSSYKTTE
jgi:hypothetical protein